jgi:hypothetical protein
VLVLAGTDTGTCTVFLCRSKRELDLNSFMMSREGLGE